MHPSAFPRFDISLIPECDRQTDGHTDIPSIAYTTLAKLALWCAVIKIINQFSGNFPGTLAKAWKL